MKSASKIALLLFVGVSFALFEGCKPESCDEQVPVIEYKDFVRLQDSALLTITVIDCDGDIGLSDEDTVPPFDHNFYVSYLEWIDGEWVKLQLNEDNDLNYRIPVVESEGNSDKLEGDIQLTMLNAKFGTADSVVYEVYLVDRALNESNHVRTPIQLFPD